MSLDSEALGKMLSPDHVISFRFLFWTDVGSHPKIEKSYLDGALRQTLVDDELVSPNHIVVDYATKR